MAVGVSGGAWLLLSQHKTILSKSSHPYCGPRHKTVLVMCLADPRAGSRSQAADRETGAKKMHCHGLVNCSNIDAGLLNCIYFLILQFFSAFTWSWVNWALRLNIFTPHEVLFVVALLREARTIFSSSWSSTALNRLAAGSRVLPINVLICNL